VEVSAPSGARGAALAGCGTGWTLAGGASAYESCPTYPIPDGLDLLTVTSRDTVSLEVPGWRILSWWVSCGDRSPDDGAFQDDPAGCWLGGHGNGADESGPARFIPFPGRHVVSAWISADRDGDTVGAQYFVEIDVQP
jgi:hypothetical protein